MIRGTTPTFTITIKDPGELDLTLAENVYFTLDQDRVKVTKTGPDLVVETATVKCWLTQEEALRFTEGRADAQLNWTTVNATDGSLRRNATKPFQVRIDRQLLDEVIA